MHRWGKRREKKGKQKKKTVCQVDPDEITEKEMKDEEESKKIYFEG